MTGACNDAICVDTFVRGKDKLKDGPPREYCILLNNYLHCLKDIRKDCKGVLSYHSSVMMVNKLIDKNECNNLLTEAELASGSQNLNTEEEPQNVEGDLDSLVDVCDYPGDPTPAHCVLFGDPHLRTFGGDFMTCRVQGAWPLLSNPYLAVQVTNEQVGAEHKATATTKVSFTLMISILEKPWMSF